MLGGVFLLTAGPAIVTGTTSSGATATSIEAAAKSREAAQIPVIEAVNTDADNFGGVYLDGTGTLVIQYVDANAGRAAIEKLIGPGVPVRWEAVTRSQSALLGLKDQVVKAWPDGVYSVGLDTTSNEVNVTVLPDASVAAIRSSLPTGIRLAQ